MRSCPQCRKILTDSAIHCPEDGHLLSAPDGRTGQLLAGQFRVLEKIGEGGSADVYRGWQQGVERVVAIKILTPSAASSSEFVARFMREAQAAARLSHANIITVYQVGRTAEELPFIAMEWIAGGPMGRDADAPLTGDHCAIVCLAKQITSALIDAHGAGIIHRDLKPDNLLVATRRGVPKVTVVDFGIAKLLDEAMIRPGETHLTKLGTVYGTPQYLSPEQACGKSVDPRSDFYSLGVVLYELVCGQLPFSSTGVVLLVDHLQSTPLPLARRAPQMPPALSALIMRLLAKDPDERPQDAKALLRLLEELDAPQSPSLSITEASLVQLRAPARIRPRASFAAALLSIAILALGSGALGNLAAAAAPLGAGAANPSAVQERASAQLTPLQGPQRALMVSANGYALRVLVPEDLRANQQQPMAIEVWDPAGRPLSLPALVVRFADENGFTEGLTVPAGTSEGRYEIVRQFSEAGAYSMEVLTEDAEVALRVHFDVREAARAPNS